MEFEVAWMWEASMSGRSVNDVKWQHFLDDHVHLLEEKFTAGNRDPFTIEVQHKGSPKTIEINFGKGTQHCPETDCTRNTAPRRIAPTKAWRARPKAWRA